MARIISFEALGINPEKIKQEAIEKLEEKNPVKCSVCGFIAKSPIGLQGHMRKHKKEGE